MDYPLMKQIIADFERSTLASLEIITNDFTLKMTKPQTTTAASIVSEPVKNTPTVSEANPNQITVKSPLVGTFFRQSSPLDKPFVEVGQRVRTGEVLCIIEAMKIMNEITAPSDGIIEAILVKNGQAIGFDQGLFVLNHAA